MTKHKIIIVGSGFAGICMGIKLKQAGMNDFIILEKAEQLGGTWRENTYPGAECDIPSALYSYSFAPNPNWEHVWSKRKQIFQYQKDVAESFDLMPHFRFGVRVFSAQYDQKQWLIDTNNGTFCAQHFISAIGQLHERFTPEIDGTGSFEGHQFHAAKWDHDVDLKNKRIAVIGSAASAVQLIPEIAKQAKELVVFQRSPNWMMSKPNRAYSNLEKWLAKRVPMLSKAYRSFLYLLADGVLYPALRGNALAKWFVKLRVQWNLRKYVKDPALRKKLTPSYPVGAKRILFSHTFYQTLAKPNVRLETEAISHFTANGIETQNGQKYIVDVAVFATGFITNPFFKSIKILGEQQSLQQAWQDGAQAYLGIYTNGFPNLHMMYGPNTNLGHNSIIIMIEAQADFITKNITRLDAQNKVTIQVTKEAESKYNHELQGRLKDMVFSKITRSWYMDNGKITNNWAGSTWEYKKRLAENDLNAFQQH